MHEPHDHAHHPHNHARPPQADAGISLLRLSAAARLGIALALSGVIWLIVYTVATA